MTQTKTITVNPLGIKYGTLDSKDLEALEFFFKNTPETLWNNERPYECVYQNIKYQFCFTHSLLRQGKRGERFAIFDTDREPIGKGAYGMVYLVLGFIKFEAHRPVLNDDEKHVIKIEDHMKKERKELVEAEYAFLKRSGYIHVKPPIFVFNEDSKKSYLPMDRADGVTLEYLLWETGRLGRLTVAERLDITFAILRAVKSQVTDKGIIHRDLKPINMTINMKITPPSVVILDYGHALNEGVHDFRVVGTTAYRSPESFISPVVYSFKSDAYSVGRILSYLWGDTYTNYYPGTKKIWSWSETKAKSQNNALFSCTGVNLFQRDEVIIRTCLNGLLQENPDTRSTLNEALEQFSKVAYSMYQQPAIQNFSKAELRHYERSLGKLELINKLLKSLSLKGDELEVRGYVPVAKKVRKLHQQLYELTEVFSENFVENPEPALVATYSKSCSDKIEKYRAVFQSNRNLLWLIGEIATAIGLLGVGYVVALGVNYHFTKRWGLFSQTQTDRIAQDLKDNINYLVP